MACQSAHCLVFSPRDATKTHDPKTDKLSEVIYWQGGKSKAMFLSPREKRGEAVPAKYRGVDLRS